MTTFEEPILPPEESNAGNRYESSNIDSEQLHEFLNTTVFEDREEIVKVLSNDYGMVERDDVDRLRSNMTRVFDVIKMQTVPKTGDEEYFGTPLSGKEPKSVIRTRIKTLDGNAYDLTVFEVFNRNNYFRHEYVITPVEELEQAG